MRRWQHRASRAIGPVVVALAAVVAMLVATEMPAAAALPSGAPALSGGVDGQVYATLVVGDTLYVGGSFSNALVQGGGSTTRDNLAAFSLGTGALLGSWKADTNGIVRSLATAGSYLYVGGGYTTIGGVAQGRLARVSLATGALDTGFKPKLNGTVRAVAVGGGDVYAGGGFTLSGGTPQTDLAKFDSTTGAKIGSYAASTDGAVDTLALSPDGTRLAVGGNFDTLSGTSRRGMGLVDPGTGSVVGPAFAGSVEPMLSVSWSDDGTALFGGSGNGNNLAARWNPGNGARVWGFNVGGDVQAVDYYDGNVYVGFHDNYQGDTHTKLLGANASTGAISATFRPTFNQFWGVRTISAGPWGLVIGGQFTKLSDVWAHNVATWPSVVSPTITIDAPGQTVYGSKVGVDVTIPGSTGTVTLTGGGPKVVESLQQGAASFALPRTLAAGKHTLKVSYSGDRLHAAGTATSLVTVTRAATKVRTTVTRKATTHRAGMLKIKVASTGGGGSAPGGTVTLHLTRGSHHRSLKPRSLKAGTVTVTLPRLGAGSWRLVATYSGDADHLAASHHITLKVGKKH